MTGAYELQRGLRDGAGSAELIRLTIRASVEALVWAGLIGIFAAPPALESYLQSSSASSGSDHRDRLIFTMEQEKREISSRAPSDLRDHASEVLIMPKSPPGCIYDAPAFIVGVMAWREKKMGSKGDVELRLPFPSDTLLEAGACALSAAGHTVLYEGQGRLPRLNISRIESVLDGIT